MAVLTVENIEKAYSGRVVLDGISLQVQKGERVGLVGPNGAGKTTLMKIIAGLEEPDHGSVAIARSADMSYVSQQPRLDPHPTLRPQVELVFEHLRRIERDMEAAAEQLAHHASGPEHDAALERFDTLQTHFQHMGGWDMQRRVDTVLDQLGFKDAEMDLNISALSGGQKSRAQLACMLLESPDLLLLDEPTNHLDMPMLAWLEQTINDMTDAAMLIISHDRYFLDSVATRIIDLRHHQIEEYNGNYSAYMAQRAERRLAQARVYDQQQAYIAKQEEYIRRFSAGQRARQARGRKTLLERFKTETAVSAVRNDKSRMILNLEVQKHSGQEVLRLEGLCKAYGPRVLLNNLEFNLPRGTRLGVVGPNGSGKSTLLNILAGLAPADSGEIHWGHAVSLQYFRQEHQDLTPGNTVMQELHAARPMASPQDIRDIAALFVFSGDTIEKAIGTLSGGEKSRVAMAKLLLKPGNTILLDEPTNHLDMDTCQVVESALESFDGTLIVVSHDRYFLDAVCDQILAVQPGENGRAGWELVKGGYSDYLNHLEDKKKRLAQESRKAARVDKRGEPRRQPAKNAAPPKPHAASRAHAVSPALQRLSIADIEKLIARHESDLRDCEQSFADPAVAGQPARLKAVNEKYERLKVELAQAMAAWEIKSEE